MRCDTAPEGVDAWRLLPEGAPSRLLIPASVVAAVNDAIQAVPLMRGDDMALILDPVYRSVSVVRGGAAWWFDRHPDDPRYVCTVVRDTDTALDCLHFDPEDEAQWYPVLVGVIVGRYVARTGGGDDIVAERLGADDDYAVCCAATADYLRANDPQNRCPYCGGAINPFHCHGTDLEVGPRAGTDARMAWFCSEDHYRRYVAPYGHGAATPSTTQED